MSQHSDPGQNDSATPISTRPKPAAYGHGGNHRSPSYLVGLYLLSSSSSVSLRMVMTLTGGLGVSGMMIG